VQSTGGGLPDYGLAPPLKPGGGELALRGVDQYFGGLLIVGYVF